MAILKERLEETRQLIEGQQENGFRAIDPQRFYDQLERANKKYAELLLADLQKKGLFNNSIHQTPDPRDPSTYLSDFSNRLGNNNGLNHVNGVVGESYNQIYKLLKTFMDKFSLEDKADEQEKERAAKYDNKERQRAMAYRLLTTFLVGIVFMALAYIADIAGFQFIFLHKKPVCPESYVCIRQEDHDKQQKELEELTKRAASYAMPAAKLINPIPSELKIQPDVIQNTKATSKQKE